MPTAKKKKGPKLSDSSKTGTEFGRIYGKLCGEGCDSYEAAAIAYKACGESVLADRMTAVLREAKMCREDFKGLVAKLMKKGYSKEYAQKIAGKVAREKGAIPGHKK